MHQRTMLGVLTPSSNTVLEPMMSQILAHSTDVSAHFSRLRVTEISLKPHALDQFDLQPFIEASQLLTDAMVNNIVWSGTAAGWLGFDTDRALCDAIRNDCGVEATTSVLALNEALNKRRVNRLGLVTPYLSDVQSKIVQNYAETGIECVAERHFNDKGNYSFSEYSEALIAQSVREVAAEGNCQAIAIFCTNMRGARVAAALEKELNIPIYDSVSVGVWKSLLLADKDPSRITGWGSVFELH